MGEAKTPKTQWRQTQKRAQAQLWLLSSKTYSANVKRLEMLFLRVMSNEHFPARLERLHSTFFLFKSVLEYITASCERQNGTVQRIKYSTSI